MLLVCNMVFHCENFQLRLPNCVSVWIVSVYIHPYIAVTMPAH